MGGTIAVTIRTPDGQVYKMARWTNPLPYFVMHPRFVHDDPDWVEKYLAYWRSLCQDWEDNQATGNYRHQDTPYYCPHQVCAPTGYGLVFIDMVEKVIHEHQGYTSFTSVYGYHFDAIDGEPESFQQFAREGRLTVQRFNDKARHWEDTGKLFDGTLPEAAKPAYWRSLWRTLGYRSFLENLEGFGRTLREQLENIWFRRKSDNRFKLKLSLAPYQVIDWEEIAASRLEQFAGMRDAIGQLIPLTPDDLAEWDHWFDELREEEREELEAEEADAVTTA